jgi:hypothetical protein
MSLYCAPGKEDFFNQCLQHHLLNFDPLGLEPIRFISQQSDKSIPIPMTLNGILQVLHNIVESGIKSRS